MNTKLRLLRRLWPLLCGLVVGGLLGGLTRSWAIGAIFGGVAALYFFLQLTCKHTGLSEMGYQSRHGSIPSFRETHERMSRAAVQDVCDLEQQVELYAQGAAGVGPYAHLGKDHE